MALSQRRPPRPPLLGMNRSVETDSTGLPGRNMPEIGSNSHPGSGKDALRLLVKVQRQAD